MKHQSFYNIIRLGFSSLFHICAKELKSVFKDQGVLIFFILVPLAYPLVYAFIYTQEVVRDVPIAVVDNNRSSMSREFLRMVDATPDVKIQSYCADMEEAQNLIEETRVYGIIYIPEEFTEELSEGKQTKVTIYSDMSGLLYYKSLLMATTNVSLEMNKKIKIERMGNTTNRQDEIGVAPIEYEEVSLASRWFCKFSYSSGTYSYYPTDSIIGYRIIGWNSKRNQSFPGPCST